MQEFFMVPRACVELPVSDPLRFGLLAFGDQAVDRPAPHANLLGDRPD